jgi:multidrug resistance efflux pump
MPLSYNLIAVAVLLTGQSSGDQRPTPNELKLSKSMVSLIRHNQIAALQAGVIKELALPDGSIVQEGLSVTKGQVLGRLNDEDALARKSAAQAEHRVSIADEAKAKASILASAATVEVAKAEVAVSEAIRRAAKAGVSDQEYRRQQLTVTRAQSENDVAGKEAETAALTVEAKQAQLEVANITVKHHRIESPLDGIIVQLYRRQGDWVSPGDPIMRVVYMDKLRVEGFVNADKYTPDEVFGKAVEVTAYLPRDRVERFTAAITYVSPLVEASGEYRVWCEVDNRQHNGHWILRPGMTAEMTIKLNSQAVKVATSSP